MSSLVWIGFFVVYCGLLALDLSVLHREARLLHVGQALGWTCVWIAVALAFSGVIYGLYEYGWFGGSNGTGEDAWLQFVSGYLLEWSLSFDNLFVIAMIFAYMKIPPVLQYRVLFWGIVGAIVLRGAMIALGSALIHTFDWMFYVFGAILLISAARMLRSDEAYDPSKSFLVRVARKFYPVTEQLDGENFFTRVAASQGKRAATPLFVTLLFIDFADVVFAVDSIPAIFAVTQDTFLVFTSNAIAILGLRSLYFAIVGMMTMFRYLKISLVFILAFIAVKLILVRHVEISHGASLAVIAGLLSVGVLASVVKRLPD